MRAIILSSGGVDSTTCLGIAVDKYGSDRVSTVMIHYGQKHVKELDCAKMIARYYGVSHYELDAENVFKYSNSALLSKSKQKVAEASYSAQMKENGSSKVNTYVPFRNGLMLSMAASFADSLYGDEEIELYIGVHKDDAAVNAYADCSTSFVDAMASAISIGTYGRIHLVAPFIDKNKAEVVRTGLNIGVPYHLTWSCYEGGQEPCGKCATCIDRAKAFSANKVQDPIFTKPTISNVNLE